MTIEIQKLNVLRRIGNTDKTKERTKNQGREHISILPQWSRQFCRDQIRLSRYSAMMKLRPKMALVPGDQ
jgi:hypothetical protein